MVLLEMISHLVAFFGNFYLVFSFMDYEEMYKDYKLGKLCHLSAPYH